MLSATEKLANKKLVSWREDFLSECCPGEPISDVHLFYCSAHVLHRHAVAQLKEQQGGLQPLGRDALPQFANLFT